MACVVFEGRILRLQKASYLAAGSAIGGVDEPLGEAPPVVPGKCIGFESPLTDIDCSYIML